MKEKISEKDAVRGYVQNAIFLSSLFWREIKDLVFENGADIEMPLRNLDSQAGTNILFALVGQNLSVIKDFDPIFQEPQKSTEREMVEEKKGQITSENLGGFQRTMRIEYYCYGELANFCGSSIEGMSESEIELVNKYRQVQIESINCRQNPFENITGDLLCRLFGEKYPQISARLKENFEGSFFSRATEVFTQCAGRAFQFWKELGGVYEFYESPIPLELAIPSQVLNGIPIPGNLEKAKPLEIPRLPDLTDGARIIGKRSCDLPVNQDCSPSPLEKENTAEGPRQPTPSRKVKCVASDNDFMLVVRPEGVVPPPELPLPNTSVLLTGMRSAGGFSEGRNEELRANQELRAKNYLPLPRMGINPISEVELFQEKARAGDKDAQFQLGLRFLKGKGFAKDYPKAWEWFLQAGKKGHIESQVMLGCLAFRGKGGIPKDYVKAFGWFANPASKGNPVAQRYLGTCFLQGKGKPVTFKKARKWFQRSAESGDVVSQRNLGIMMFHGQGGIKNIPMALSWFQKAAIKGDRLACRNLGIMYFNGNGIKRNPSKARAWFLRAVKSGDNDSRLDLGLLFFRGVGVEKDAVIAKKWLAGFIRRTRDSVGKSKAMEMIKSINRDLPVPSGRGYWVPRILATGIFLLGILIIMDRLYLFLR